MSHCLGLVSDRSCCARGTAVGSGSTQTSSTRGAKSGCALAVAISLCEVTPAVSECHMHSCMILPREAEAIHEMGIEEVQKWCACCRINFASVQAAAGP